MSIKIEKQGNYLGVRSEDSGGRKNSATVKFRDLIIAKHLFYIQENGYSYSAQLYLTPE